MGIFHVDIKISSPGAKAKSFPVQRLMVDSGSEVTWVPAKTLKAAGVTVRKKDQLFIMANGQTITRDVGYAVLRCGDFETVDEVVFAREGDCKLLGARTLEGFNAHVDPVKKRLVAAGPMPAASAPLWSADKRALKNWPRINRNL